MARKKTRDAAVEPPKEGGTATAATASDTISFDYIKSNLFRVIHVDGVVGGPTPNGYINMAVWNQRVPYPKQVTHSVDGQVLGPEVARAQREAIVRELEAGLIFDVEMAKVMLKWLRALLREAGVSDEDLGA